MSAESRLAAWVAMLRRERVSIAVVVALLAAFVLGLWWQGIIFTNDRPVVPSCPELAEALPTAAGGTWAVSKPDPSRRPKKTSTFCKLAFISADQRYSGTVSVLISSDTDEEALRQRVLDGQCFGPVLPPDTASDGYLAFKTCDDTFRDLIRAGVLAARRPRFAHMTVSIDGPPGPQADAFDFARDLARTVADQGLTIPASE